MAINNKKVKSVLNIITAAVTIGIKITEFMSDAIKRGDSLDDIGNRRCKEIPGFMDMLERVKKDPNVDDADFSLLHDEYDKVAGAGGIDPSRLGGG